LGEGEVAGTGVSVRKKFDFGHEGFLFKYGVKKYFRQGQRIGLPSRRHLCRRAG
jgi:hypothetical protein